MLRKENRWECLFCSSYEICYRLEVNDLILREIERNGKCPDRIPIFINPSLRIPFSLVPSKHDRNKEMLEKGKPDLVVAFHENLEKSKGTKNMIMQAKAKGVPIKVFGHKKE